MTKAERKEARKLRHRQRDRARRRARGASLATTTRPTASAGRSRGSRSASAAAHGTASVAQVRAHYKAAHILRMHLCHRASVTAAWLSEQGRTCLTAECHPLC